MSLAFFRKKARNFKENFVHEDDKRIRFLLKFPQNSGDRQAEFRRFAVTVRLKCLPRLIA